MSAPVTEVEVCDPIEGCGEPIRGLFVHDPDDVKGDRLFCIPCADVKGIEISE